MKIRIIRNEYSDKEVLGDLSVINNDQIIFKCKTLELPDKNNAHKVSCIPKGIYHVEKRKSAKYGGHFHILNVPGRDMILIHSGNYYTQILGCVLVGDGFADINHDGHRDVLNSKKTLLRLIKVMPQSFELEIS